MQAQKLSTLLSILLMYKEMVRPNQRITDPNTNPVNNPMMRNQSPPTQDVAIPNYRKIRQGMLYEDLRNAVQNNRDGLQSSNYQDIVKRMTRNFD
jgi:hypothetical protein